MKTIITFLILTLATPVYALNLTIYTEEFPPFNYTQQGKITGVSSEVVKNVMAATGYHFKIKALPWSESYKRAQSEKNTLIYSISRTKSREHLFKWIGVVAPTTYSVKALVSRKDIKIKRLQDMKHYRIGTNVDDVMEHWLLHQGFQLSDFTRTTGKYSTLENFENLLNNKIDVWPAPDAVAYYIARQQGHSNPDAIMKSVFKLQALSGGYYIAGGLNTPDNVIATITKALNDFKKTDKFFKILANYGVDAMGLKTPPSIVKLVYSFQHLTRLMKVGYLADDRLASHREGGLYRKAMREPLIEMYADNFNAWKKKFLALQDRVDAIIIGDVSQIKGWQNDQAETFVQRMTREPTGYVLDGMGGLAMIGYDGNDFTVNMKIARAAHIDIPKGIIRMASRVIK